MPAQAKVMGARAALARRPDRPQVMAEGDAVCVALPGATTEMKQAALGGLFLAWVAGAGFEPATFGL